MDAVKITALAEPLVTLDVPGRVARVRLDHHGLQRCDETLLRFLEIAAIAERHAFACRTNHLESMLRGRLALRMKVLVR